MEKIQQWRDGISWFIAAISVAISYELRNNGIVQLPQIGISFLDDALPAIIATIILLVSLSTARFITKWAISQERIRAYILGENFVEGFWYLQTDPHEEIISNEFTNSPLSPDGVLWLRYEPSWGQFSVTTTRINEKGLPYQIPSKLINMRIEGQLLLYVNYFIVNNIGSHSTEGVSKGCFVKKGDFSKTKDRLDAYIFTEGENTRHQWAERIDSKEIMKCKTDAIKDGSNNWMQTFLTTKSA